MNNIKLSIIIPCYKVEQYLNQCVESVVAYKGDDIEIILVDDGSPDRVPQMCDEWSIKDNRIKVIHKQNGGLSVARNTGIENSSGEYLWFIDSDDWIIDYSLSKVLHLIDDHPDVDIFAYPLLYSYENSSKNWIDINIPENKFMSGEEFRKMNYFGASPRCIINRSVLDSANIRYVPNIKHEDLLFGFEIFHQARKVYLQKEPIYMYRQREGSTMHTIKIGNAYDMLVIHQHLIEFLNKYSYNYYSSNNTYHASYLFNAITMVWHLKGTKEFRKYLADTRDYRIKMCNAELSVCPKERRQYYKLLAYHPIICVYRYEWKSLLINFIKAKVKKVIYYNRK